MSDGKIETKKSGVEVEKTISFSSISSKLGGVCSVVVSEKIFRFFTAEGIEMFTITKNNVKNRNHFFIDMVVLKIFNHVKIFYIFE